VLGDHGAGDGRSDGVVLQIVPGIFQAGGGVADTDAGAFNLVVHAVTGDGADPVAAGDGIAHQPVETCNFAGRLCRDDAAGPHLDGRLAVAGVAADDGAGGVVGCHKARVGEPYPDGSQGYAGGDRRGGTGHRGNRSGEGPGKAVDKDRGGLADVEVAAVRVGEVEVDVDVLIRHDLQKLCACADAVPLVHIHLADGAAQVRLGILGLHRLLIGGLGLGVAVLRLGLAAGRVGGINSIEQLALLHLVALFKGIAEDLAGDQRIDGVGVRWLQRAAGGE
ncbi:3-hydroxyacyl-CoA dehydrogenase, partial [Dysosmobacter welbionis]